jgi:hypothetical protein
VLDSFDPRQNIFGGVRYLRMLLDMFGGNLSLALAGYNAGENAVRRHNGVPPYRETRNYVDKIMRMVGGGAGFSPRGGREPAATPAASYTPSSLLGRPRPAAATRRLPASAARPRTYFRYRDERNVLVVSHEPPPEGVAYSLIRADR